AAAHRDPGAARQRRRAARRRGDRVVDLRPAAPAEAAAVRTLLRAAYAPYVEVIGREPAPMTADYEALAAAGEGYGSEAGGGRAGVREGGGRRAVRRGGRPPPGRGAAARERGGRAGAAGPRARPGAARLGRGARARSRPRRGRALHQRAHAREPPPVPAARLR